METTKLSKNNGEILKKEISTKILINNRKNLMILKKKSNGRLDKIKDYTSDWDVIEK